MNKQVMPEAAAVSEAPLLTGAAVRPGAARQGHKRTRKSLSMTRTKLCLTALALAASTTVLTAGDAGAIWEKSCQKCHGADGKGQTKMGQKMEVKDLTDAKYQGSFTDEQATKAIKEGIKDGDKTKMKPAEGLTDDDIKALVAKVRSFKS
jgi:mono/diheme cytochrome c family protein